MADQKLTALTELSVPALEDLAYIVDDPAGTPTSYKITQTRLGGLYNVGICNGRLTTESGVPVSPLGRTAQSTIYFTPYNGSRIALYDGTRWKLYAFAEVALALSGLTSGWNYDVFGYDSGGTLTLELLIWTNNTTRATALVLQDGVWLKTGATTRRYLGTIRTTSSTTTEDSFANRYVWNAQNRVQRPMGVAQAGDWTYASGTVRQANGSSTYQFGVVSGLEGSAIDVAIYTACLGSTLGPALIGVGADSITAISATCFGGYAAWSGGVIYGGSTARLILCNPLGYHYYAWLEASPGGGTSTFYANGYTTIYSGMNGVFEC